MIDMKKLLYYTCAIAILAINTDYTVAAQNKATLPTSKEIDAGLAVFDHLNNTRVLKNLNDLSAHGYGNYMMENPARDAMYISYYNLQEKIKNFQKTFNNDMKNFNEKGLPTGRQGLFESHIGGTSSAAKKIGLAPRPI